MIAVSRVTVLSQIQLRAQTISVPERSGPARSHSAVVLGWGCAALGVGAPLRATGSPLFPRK